MIRTARPAPLLALALVLALATPAAAAISRDGRLSPAGFQLGFQLGANACVADGRATCGGLDPGVMLLAAPSYRFTPWLSLSLDLQVAWFTTSPTTDDPVGGSVWAVSAMPTLRGHLPLGPGAVLLGFGFGYDSFSQDITDNTHNGTATWSTFLALKGTLGYLFELSPSWALGVELQAFLNPSTGTSCADLDGFELCEDVSSDQDVSERVTIGAYGVWRF